MRSGAPVLALERVRKSLGDRLVLDDMDLEAPSGKLVQVVGHNGSGKTTFLRVCAGLLRCDGGDVRIAGLPPARAHGLFGYLPQELELPGNEHVWELVRFFARLRRAGDDEVERVLDVLGLLPLADERISKLSGGLRRRVAVSVSLLGAPALLLLDEPFSNLDPEGVERLGEALDAHLEAGGVLVLTSPGAGNPFADRPSVYLEKGKLWHERVG